MTNNSNITPGRRGATAAGLGGLALASVLLLCGAGNAPIENFTPQGAMQADLNAGGHSVTNAATVNATNVAATSLTTASASMGTLAATNVTVSGALNATNFTLPFSSVKNRADLDPSNIMPGITAWFDPAKLDLADGTAVSSVPDALGTSATLSQPTSGSQPVYKVTGINGQPALLYNGTSDYLLSSFLLNSAYNHAFTLVAVLQPNNTNLQGFAVSVDLQFQAALYNWNNGFVAFDIGGNLIGSYGASIANYVGPMVIVMSYDGTTARTFVNGVESFETPITANLGATTALEVGAIGGGSQFSGMIRDIVVYNHGGSVNEDSAVSKWFMEHRGFSRQQIVWNGDSLTMGEAATANGGLPYVSAALIGPSALAWSACNTGWYGQTLVTEINDAGNRMYPGVMPGFNPLAVVWFGTNDLALGAASATTIFADYRYYCLQLQALGYKVIAVTMLPRQDAAQTAGFETARKSFNSSVVTSWATFADGLADLGDDPTIGVYGASSNTTYYNADKIHLLNAGYLIAAPTVANAIKHALRQPVYLSGTLAAGTCTINDADLVPGIAPSAPVHLWSSGGERGDAEHLQLHAANGRRTRADRRAQHELGRHRHLQGATQLIPGSGCAFLRHPLPLRRARDRRDSSTQHQTQNNHETFFPLFFLRTPRADRGCGARPHRLRHVTLDFRQCIRHDGDSSERRRKPPQPLRP